MLPDDPSNRKEKEKEEEREKIQKDKTKAVEKEIRIAQGCEDDFFPSPPSIYCSAVASS
jgi:hypothetical protein